VNEGVASFLDFAEQSPQQGYHGQIAQQVTSCALCSLWCAHLTSLKLSVSTMPLKGQGRWMTVYRFDRKDSAGICAPDGAGDTSVADVDVPAEGVIQAAVGAPAVTIQQSGHAPAQRNNVQTVPCS